MGMHGGRAQGDGMKLGNMLPGLANDCIPNGLYGDAITGGEDTPHFAVLPTLAGVYNLLGCKLGQWMHLSFSLRFGMRTRAVPLATSNTFGVCTGTVAFTTSGTALPDHILRIGLTGVCPKMIGAHTPLVVAPMADIQPRGNGAISQFVGNAAGMDGTAIHPELGIAVSADALLPQPAITRLVDLGPEPLGYISSFREVGALTRAVLTRQPRGAREAPATMGTVPRNGVLEFRRFGIAVMRAVFLDLAWAVQNNLAAMFASMRNLGSVMAPHHSLQQLHCPYTSTSLAL